MATTVLTASPEPAELSKKRIFTQAEIEVDLSQPEPPSKKAKRALKKGKLIQSRPRSSDGKAETDEKVNSSASNKAAVKERSPHGVWIGNLRFTVTKAELRQWLVAKSGGLIVDEAITRVHLPTTRSTQSSQRREGEYKTANRGFAYVDFDSLQARVAAMALSETELCGRRLLIKESHNFDGRPEKKRDPAVVNGQEDAITAEADGKETSKKNSRNAITKIFVGNLPFNTTEDALWEQFSKCGMVRWVKIATFEDTGKCKGYGWVNFEDADAAQWAVKGFAKIKETIDTERDFMVQNEENEGHAKQACEHGDGRTKNTVSSEVANRTKTRKWWVNQFLGRTLKIELAEDDQVRYKKRFGKDAQKEKLPAREGQHPARQHEGTSACAQDRPIMMTPEGISESCKAQPLNVATDISTARLTGAPVASQGTKITFDS